MKDLLDFWMATTRLPDGVGGGGGGEEGGDEGSEPASFASIREKLGLREDENPEEYMSEFTDEERASLLKDGGGDDDQGEGEGGQEADNGGEGADRKPAGKSGEEDKGPDDQGPEPKGYVKLQALHEARQENRELRQRLDQVVKDQNEFQQRLVDRLTEIRQGKKAGEQQEEVPDENKDPIAAIAYLKKQNQELLDRINGKETEETQARQEGERLQQYTDYVVNTADTILQAAAKEDPTINDAFVFAQRAVVQELQAKGYTGKRLEEAYQKVLVGYAEQAPPDPKQFAEYVRRNARYWGWDGKPLPKQGQQKNGKTNGEGGEQLTPAQKLELLRRGTKSAKTLSGGGHGTGGELNVDDLAEMSGEELEELAAKNPELFEAAVKRQ